MNTAQLTHLKQAFDLAHDKWLGTNFAKNHFEEHGDLNDTDRYLGIEGDYNYALGRLNAIRDLMTELENLEQ